jgi:hypothetical protein
VQKLGGLFLNLWVKKQTKTTSLKKPYFTGASVLLRTVPPWSQKE